MKGLQHFHRLGEASNYHSPFDGLRANGSLRLSTALFRLMQITGPNPVRAPFADYQEILLRNGLFNPFLMFRLALSKWLKFISRFGQYQAPLPEDAVNISL